MSKYLSILLFFCMTLAVWPQGIPVRMDSNSGLLSTNFFKSNVVAGSGATITYDGRGRPTIAASGGGGGSATNAVTKLQTNGVTFLSTSTTLNFSNGANVTVAGTASGTTGTVTIAASGGSGIATQDGNGTNTTLTTFKSIAGTNATVKTLDVTVTQTNFGKVAFTNGARIEQVSATITRFTNSTFDFGGAMTFSPDNTYTIGAAGGLRPATVYAAGSLQCGDYYGFISKGYTYAIGDGIWRMTDSAGADFTRLQFGGTSAEFPALGKTAGNGHLRILDGTGAASTNSLVFAATIDTTARTGMTMNRQTGRVKLSSGGQTYLLTNNLATTSSAIMATVNSDDATATSCKAIPTAGLITLKLNGVAAADTEITFLISSP